MDRLHKLLNSDKKGLLSVFYTAGFPHLDDTAKIAAALEKAGADIIEIGIPFSDPVADGPTIQESNKIALTNGMTVALLLEQVKALRQHVTIPILLMGYLNPVYQYGMERFCKDAAAAGVDGLILPDLPMEEYQQEYKAMFEAAGLSNTFLISPTTSEARIRQIDDVSNSFIYAVSSTSTTGAKGNFTDQQVAYFKRLKGMNLKNPFLIGFGISNHEAYTTAGTYSAGAIVGSAFVNLLKNTQDLEADVTQFVAALKNHS